MYAYIIFSVIQGIITLNSNLEAINVSVTGYNSYYSIVCTMKNNRVVMSGIINTKTNIAPNEEVVLGVIEEKARPSTYIPTMVGVLGTDAVTQTSNIGQISPTGEIVVKNTLTNMYTAHFYFDAVWDV